MRAPLLLLVSLISGLPGCGPPEVPAAPVLMIGIDGLEPDIVADLIEAGRMPNLAALAERGTLGSIATMVPTWSPVIWTTIATGQDVREHGINFFLETSSGLPFTSNSRRVPALWNLVSDAGRTVDVAGWWVSWPAEQVNGRIVASYAAQAQAHLIWKPTLWAGMQGQTHPLSLAAEIEPLVTYAEDGADVYEDLWTVFDKPAVTTELTSRCVTDLAWTFRGDRSFAAVGQHFLANDPADLVMLYMSLPDVAGHRFWRYHAPGDFDYEVDVREIDRFGDYIHTAYELFDAQLGELLQNWPADGNVIVLSDHGMHADLETLDDPEAITSGHHQTGPGGLFVAAGPAFALRGNLLGSAGNSKGLVGDVKGVAPLVLRLLGIPVPKHWDYARRGNPLEDLLAADWAGRFPARRGPNPDAAWREANPPGLPIDPGGGQSEQFIELFDALGYFRSEEDGPDEDDLDRDDSGEGE